MRVGQLIIVLVLIGMYGPTSAEFYRYIDEEGKVRYTDNLGNVPVDQRTKAHEYEELDDQFAPKNRVETEKPEAESSAESRKETKEKSPKKETTAKEVEEKTQEQKLREVGAKLNEEYQTLMKEKTELEKLSTSQLAEAERKELIKKVHDYNLRTEYYEKKRDVFNKEVEAYNASIKKED